MRDIVGIGAAVFDTLITLPQYPTEDTKLRAEGTKSVGGGPAATGIVAAAKLGESTGCPPMRADSTFSKILKNTVWTLPRSMFWTAIARFQAVSGSAAPPRLAPACLIRAICPR